MTSHPNAAGLGVHWLIFGSSGHITRPEGGVLRNFTKCASHDFEVNYYVKTIIDTSRVAVFGIHVPAVCRAGYYPMDETGVLIRSGITQEVHYNHIRINHYFCKSREEFAIKKDIRGDVNALKRTMKDFDIHDRNECTDIEILSHM